jgi:hypothetical protein
MDRNSSADPITINVILSERQAGAFGDLFPVPGMHGYPELWPPPDRPEYWFGAAPSQPGLDASKASAPGIDPMLTAFGEYYSAATSGSADAMKLFEQRHPGVTDVFSSLLKEALAAAGQNLKGKADQQVGQSTTWENPICPTAADGKLPILQELLAAIQSGDPASLALFGERHANWFSELSNPPASNAWITPSSQRSGDVAIIEEWIASKADGSVAAMDLFSQRHPDWDLQILNAHQDLLGGSPGQIKPSPAPSPGDWIL